MRITKVMLDASLNYINRMTEDEHTLEGAYGGWKLCRTFHGVIGGHTVFHLGYMPKAKLYDMMQAYARGLEMDRIEIKEGA